MLQSPFGRHLAVHVLLLLHGFSLAQPVVPLQQPQSLQQMALEAGGVGVGWKD